ncbi:cation transporter [Romeria aff. gracilis LEGE 07310]|uniref:Cation transporter n=1 Tax=Vasconcelosia minhoensis LEGE 07310 TaxID=915328 RepID=A0A8J7AY53_9CYAN|nr:cation transporter [Romeria gracilis]MBE9079803.1 cation transporter [Romeria aff. gracilis LEGE 07310]
MQFKFSVPTLTDQKSAEQLKETILTTEPKATVNVDSDAKTVTIDSEASEETFKEVIVAADHKIG